MVLERPTTKLSSRLGYYIAVQKFTHTSHLIPPQIWSGHAKLCGTGVC